MTLKTDLIRITIKRDQLAVKRERMVLANILARQQGEPHPYDCDAFFHLETEYDSLLGELWAVEQAIEKAKVKIR